MIPRFAVIPTTGRECLWECLNALPSDLDGVFVTFAPPDDDAEVWWEAEFGGVMTIRVPAADTRNISKWWNIGLTHARLAAGLTRGPSPKWDVAILNDDAIVPPDWFDRVSGTMRQMKVAAAAMSDTVSLPILHTRPGVTGLSERMPGFAFMLTGELGVRADEQFQWWCGDNDIDMQSRLKGGTVIIPGRVQHLYPDQSTVGELAARTAIDMQLFVDKWGHRPW